MKMLIAFAGGSILGMWVPMIQIDPDWGVHWGPHALEGFLLCALWGVAVGLY